MFVSTYKRYVLKKLAKNTLSRISYRTIRYLISIYVWLPKQYIGFIKELVNERENGLTKYPMKHRKPPDTELVHWST